VRFAASIIAAIATTAISLSPAVAADKQADPLGSPRWGDMEQVFLAGQQYVFDSRVKVEAPEDAEDPMNVPVTIDASALPDVKEVLVFADFNPILEILRFYPDATPPYLGFRAKLQQSSPVRAAARTGDGVWHVGGTIVNTVGGGCTAPSVGSASPEWQKRLNEVSARVWTEGPMSGRLRLRIIHPMDTGLVSGIPVFHLETLTLRDEAGKPVARLKISEPVSENPVFTLNRGQTEGALRAEGRDNNGNTLNARIAP
jgi:sulfur-oxidizing protein SoxY